MSEVNSLILLANVALKYRPKTIPPVEVICHRRPKRKNTTLTIKKKNGEDYADITNLKCMPIGFLSKMFVHNYVDKKLRCSVYVCKFGEKYCCNTRFVDVKENRIIRLEHLVRCHLIEHLVKTKTGSMVRLPKFVSASEENIIPSIHESKLMVKARPKTKYEEIEWKSVKQKVVDSTAANTVEEATSKAVPLQELGIMENDDNIPKRNRTDGAVIMKSESRCTTIDDRTSLSNLLSRIKVDHPYCNMNKTPSDLPIVLTNRCPIIPAEHQRVNVNQLHYLNGESSSELNNFMIHETLNEEMSIMSMDDGETTFDQLPLVGREVEVTTEDVEAITDESRPRLGESYFPCSKCDIVLSSKQVLCSHMRNKHFDATMVRKPYKEPIRTRNRTVTVEPKTSKRKFVMLSSYRNSFLNEEVKENDGYSNTTWVNQEESILKAALLKDSNKKPVINISNVLNNINVKIH